MRFRSLTITAQLVITAVLIIGVVISVFGFFYSKTSDILIEKNKKYSTEITSNIKRSIGTYFDEIGNILHNIGYDLSTQNYLTEKDPAESYDLSKNLMYMSINMINIKKDILDIVIIGENGSYYTMNGEYNAVRNFMTAVPADGKIYNSEFEKLSSINNNGRIAILYGMHITSAFNQSYLGKKIGFAGIVVDLNPIFDEIGTITNNTEIQYYLVDKKGNVYSKKDPLKLNDHPERINSILEEKEKKPDSQDIYMVNGMRTIVLVNDIPQIEGKIIGFVPEKELFLEIAQVRRIVLAVLLVAILLLSVLFVFITNNITHPVKKLIGFMNTVTDGNIKSLKQEVRLEGYYEITELSREFNAMMKELNNLTHRLIETNSKLYESEIEKEKSELAFLRSQINPHFLYNTLEVMKGIALDEEVEKLYDMANALSLVFRYSIKGSDIVELREEFDIVKAYVRIHLIRFGKRLEAEYKISEETLGRKVPKMILQPVVENAISHGLEAKRGLGTLRIGSSLDGDTLRIWVMDNGVGIEEDKLADIRRKLSGAGRRDSAAGAAGTGSIGLFNVDNRIKLIYGNDYGISIHSIENVGTEVFISVPAEGGGNVQSSDCG
jgi:two-component system sensor histidine kinase YesM